MEVELDPNKTAIAEPGAFMMMDGSSYIIKAADLSAVKGIFAD